MEAAMWMLLTWACSQPAPPPSPVAVGPARTVPRAAASPLRFAGLVLPNPPPTDLLLGSVVVEGRTEPLQFHELARIGQRFGEGPPFGTILREDGSVLPAVPRSRREAALPYCNGLDFTSLYRWGGQWRLLHHLECVTGAIQVGTLARDPQGRWALSESAPVPDQPLGGIWNPCAGSTTPWGSHLGSEEFEPDARGLTADGDLDPDFDGWGAWPAIRAQRTTPPRPYAYGGVPELDWRDGKWDLRRHLSLGRFSHEIAVVLEDRRTVYLTDDGSHAGGFFLFVADQPGDLSVGKLYAARMEAEGDVGALSERPVRWVPLDPPDMPPASQSELEAAVAAGITFADLLVAETASGSSCVDGTPVRGLGKTSWECLRPAAPNPAFPRAAALAARLETRRIAALAGATTEWTKTEGLAWDARQRELYLAVSAVRSRMTEEAGAPTGSDHLRFAENRCGAVLRGRVSARPVDTRGVGIDSELVLDRFSAAVAGRPQGDGCDLEALANPDNLAWLPGHDVLVIAEDSEHHPNDQLWAWHRDTQELRRMALAPPEAEFSGITWHADVEGEAWLTLVIQAPYDSQVKTDAPWPADAPYASRVGLVGPFPAGTLAPSGGPR